ncbi:MAG TPA: adenylate/guanylate cyclase domain-containing protein [Gaiellaceae bacterium]|nr:adenylate/guanylate cyclase domain-containing protein [Gaiellaceae bacterium]
MQPQVRFARTSDDVRVAYWAHGAGPVLVQTPLVPFSHVEMEWQNPHLRRWYELLGEFVTIVRYDGRNTGLSSREVTDVSLDGQVRDLEAVIDAVSTEPAAILGVFHSGPPSVAYAAAHPERISHLLLWSTYAVGTDYWRAAQSEGLRVLRQTDYRLFLRTAAHELLGWADDEEADRYSTLMAAAVSPEDADRLIAETRAFDVTAEASQGVQPTLVIHRRDVSWIDVSLSRDLASLIRNAQLTVLEGRSPLPGAGDAEGPAAVIAEFLGASPHAGSRHPSRPDRALATILFTDIVGSTERAAEIGDRAWRDVLDRHHDTVREIVSRFRGREIDAAGDGFLLLFDGPGPAIRAAQEVAEAVRHLGLEVRAGVHSGEVELVRDGVRGIAVHVGARVMALAAAGEVLVSSTVRDLVTGSDIAFDDRGLHRLKGIPGEWRVFSVRS